MTDEKIRNQIKCMKCSFCSDNVDILRLHALSHGTEAANILKEIPESLKEVCFRTKEQFKADLDTFLEKSGIKTKIDEFIMECKYVFIVKCPECGKSISKKNFKEHREVIHLKKEKGENDVTHKERKESCHRD